MIKNPKCLVSYTVVAWSTFLFVFWRRRWPENWSNRRLVMLKTVSILAARNYVWLLWLWFIVFRCWTFKLEWLWSYQTDFTQPILGVHRTAACCPVPSGNSSSPGSVWKPNARGLRAGRPRPLEACREFWGGWKRKRSEKNWSNECAFQKNDSTSKGSGKLIRLWWGTWSSSRISDVVKLHWTVSFKLYCHVISCFDPDLTSCVTFYRLQVVGQVPPVHQVPPDQPMGKKFGDPGCWSLFLADAGPFLVNPTLIGHYFCSNILRDLMLSSCLFRWQKTCSFSKGHLPNSTTILDQSVFWQHYIFLWTNIEYIKIATFFPCWSQHISAQKNHQLRLT